MVNQRVQMMPLSADFDRPLRLTANYSLDFSWRLFTEGRIFVSSDGDQNDLVTGQTSFANTTPTFILHNPAGSGVLCIPFGYQISQGGSVAGGDITVATEIVSPSAYASGGTSEKVANQRIGMNVNKPTNQCTLRSNPTATAGYGISVAATYQLAADVSAAEGIINIAEWQPFTGVGLDPNSSLNIFTYAGTTGPTWGWVFVWAELPLSWFS